MLGNVKVEISLQLLSLVEGMILTWFVNNITVQLNLLKPTGYGMHQQVEYFKNCTLCPHCIYVFCICLRTNSDMYCTTYSIN
jgi:hypothetical protein